MGIFLLSIKKFLTKGFLIYGISYKQSNIINKFYKKNKQNKQNNIQKFQFYDLCLCSEHRAQCQITIFKALPYQKIFNSIKKSIKNDYLLDAFPS